MYDSFSLLKIGQFYKFFTAISVSDPPPNKQTKEKESNPACTFKPGVKLV